MAEPEEIHSEQAAPAPQPPAEIHTDSTPPAQPAPSGTLPAVPAPAQPIPAQPAPTSQSTPGAQAQLQEIPAPAPSIEAKLNPMPATLPEGQEFSTTQPHAPVPAPAVAPATPTPAPPAPATPTPDTPAPVAPSIQPPDPSPAPAAPTATAQPLGETATEEEELQEKTSNGKLIKKILLIVTPILLISALFISYQIYQKGLSQSTTDIEKNEEQGLIEIEKVESSVDTTEKVELKEEDDDLPSPTGENEVSATIPESGSTPEDTAQPTPTEEGRVTR